MTSFRNNFFYGLIIVFPLASIIWLINLSIDVLTGPLSQLLGFELNNLNGLILSLMMLWGIGFLSRQIVSRSIFPKNRGHYCEVAIYTSHLSIHPANCKYTNETSATVSGHRIC